MTNIISTDLNILQTWLTGGNINEQGEYHLGFDTFSDYASRLTTEGKLDRAKVSDAIKLLIAQHGKDGFTCNGQTYDFDMPNRDDFELLVNRVFAVVEKRLAMAKPVNAAKSASKEKAKVVKHGKGKK